MILKLLLSPVFKERDIGDFKSVGMSLVCVPPLAGPAPDCLHHGGQLATELRANQAVDQEVYRAVHCHQKSGKEFWLTDMIHYNPNYRYGKIQSYIAKQNQVKLKLAS